MSARNKARPAPRRVWTPLYDVSPRISAIVPPFGLSRRNRSRRGLAGCAFNGVRKNFALSKQPIDVGVAFGSTIGDPEVVGTLANGLFQIWHRILL
jgi:hypothetical protein